MWLIFPIPPFPFAGAADGALTTTPPIVKTMTTSAFIQVRIPTPNLSIEP
jgi:hypothetical protein